MNNQASQQPQQEAANASNQQNIEQKQWAIDELPSCSAKKYGRKSLI